MTVYFQEIDPRDLHEIAESYRYDAELFRPLEQAIQKRIEEYGGEYGHAIWEHLSRVSTDFKGYLLHKGYGENMALNLGMALLLHDAGKTLQPDQIWNLPKKPGDDIKRQRAEHTTLGLSLLDGILQDFPKLHNHPHLSAIACFMKYHHERVNGKGPHGLSDNQLGEILEIAGIFDAADGKLKVKGHDLAEVFKEMTGLPAYTDSKKHVGEFRQELLNDIISFTGEKIGRWILARPLPLRQAALAM